MNKGLHTDVFKGNAKKIEMSRYIDLDIYHRVERTHPFYVEMVGEMCDQISNNVEAVAQPRILEIGAGTGLLTAEILKLGNMRIDAVELDEECCTILEKYVSDPRCKCICDNAVTFSDTEKYDVVVSSFAHDHIHYDQRYDFAKNIKKNLKPGGVYIMGGEVLPYYTNDIERAKALYDYHGFIVDKALRDRNFEVAQIEINALKSGLDMTGDFKRHEAMFEEEMGSSGLNMIVKKKIGPVDKNTVGGVFVYVYQK
ncbi:MAG TPA: methyltransferase domain-containing protein [Candidatus Omnitrophota bacterium]|nr:methyltransferase domain-containing protein [Candidatus Omnitrophota bacterium]HPS19519.1 methyltransferase domain-containing protein [Candidatus Omnitrophota bacterium]